MSLRLFPVASTVILVVLVTSSVRGRMALPGLYDVLRSVMMVLGGLVVIAIILIVAVAIISGILGMIGRLRTRR